jgi:hypothetical protein
MADYCPKCKGVLNFVIEGRIFRLQSDGDVTVLVSDERRTETYDGEFTMEDRNPKITATVVVPIDVYVTYFQELCDVPVVVELCDGRTFSTDHASNVSDNPYDAKRNLQPMELICDSITELLPFAA